MRRRAFIVGLFGTAMERPLSAQAQHSATPVIGLLGHSQADAGPGLQAYRQALVESGYVVGKNIVIEYRLPGGQGAQPAELAADLVRRQVTVIVAMPAVAVALAAKSATDRIPIVFNVGVDPVSFGLVASLSRPGGNLTGVTSLNVEVGPKRLELLHQVVPTVTSFAHLVNPANPNATAVSRELQESARVRGLRIHVLQASSEAEINAAFASLAELRVGGLVISPDGFFARQHEQLAALALRHAMPTVYSFRNFAVSGGLMSYGASPAEAYRVAGVYTGRILKGEKPADMPVHQVTKVELIINLKTAKALGAAVPPSVLARADEVIE